MPNTHYDAIIIGAGISGISAAYHLQKHCPDKSYRVLERRQRIGGTWDLFNYPGIRSDSDMYTFGFSFRPWDDQAAIAEKSKIIDY
jgi:cation diffusion facilitator CzcD-associated flavoprotein CzcO